MTRLRQFAIAGLAAATVAIGSLATTATASALPMSCSTAIFISHVYMITANAYNAAGDMAGWNYWRGKAEGILAGAC